MEDDTRTLECARMSLAHGKHLQALELFLKTFKHYRQWYTAHAREQFYAALSGAMEELQLRDASDMEQFTGIVREVVCVCGGDVTPLKMLGMKCLIEGAYPQAQCLLQAVLQVHPECLSTRESLRTVFDHLVNRWHFRMLNDIRRNSAYWEAIRRAVDRVPCCSVLDIGAGTGILSMMATKAGAGRVYACEVNETMLALSQDIIAANGMSDDIILSHAYSTNLSIPKDIPERVHLVVTETVDAGLLGECIVPSLRHAWRELLLPRRSEDLTTNQMAPSGQVIPCGATVYTMAIECSEIQRQSQLLSAIVGGLDFSGVVLEGSCKAARGTEGTRGGARELEREPYTCERLTQISGGYRALTKVHKTLYFDFTNPEIPLPPECHLKLPVVEKGRVDALAMWFDLYLDSVVWLNTGPAGECCWEQAVYPIHRQDTFVEVGDSVVIRASCSEVSVNMEVSEIERAHETGVSGRGYSMSRTEEDHRRNLEPRLFPSMASDSGGGETLLGESVVAMVTEDDAGCVAASREPLSVFIERGELLRLNDTMYVEAYRRAIAGAIAAVKEMSDSSDLELEEDMSRMVLDGCGEGSPDGSEEVVGRSSQEEMSDEESDKEGSYVNCAVLDVCEGMSVCGLMAAKEGADFVQIGRVHPPYHSLLEQVAEDNGMKDKVSVKWLELPRVTTATPPMWDLIVCDVISPQGTLHTAVLEELSHVRSQLCHEESVMVVSSITVCATAISSPELRAHASVLGTVPTLGFNVAQFINQYQVAHFIDVDLSTFPHMALTDSQDVLTVDFDSLGRQPLKMKQCVSLNVKLAGSLTAFAYWFTLHLFGGITIATGPGSYQGSHWHQAAFLLPEDVTVSHGQQLTILATLQDSCIDITLQGPS